MRLCQFPDPIHTIPCPNLAIAAVGSPAHPHHLLTDVCPFHYHCLISIFGTHNITIIPINILPTPLPPVHPRRPRNRSNSHNPAPLFALNYVYSSINDLIGDDSEWQVHLDT